MIIKEYIGKVSKLESFNCQICSKSSTQKFKIIPSTVNLVNWDSLYVCKPCALRECGSKNKELINKLILEKE